MTRRPLPLEELLPHDHPMILIDDVVESANGDFCAQIRIAEDSVFFEPARGVPSYVGIEYVAQTVAALVGLRDRQNGGTVKVGYLLGTRRFTASMPYFKLGSLLTTRVTAEFESGNLAKYRGRIVNEAGEQVVETSVTVYSVTADREPE